MASASQGGSMRLPLIQDFSIAVLS
jgi:hypothetical protein